MRVTSTKYQGVSFDPDHKRGRFTDGAWFATVGRSSTGPFATEGEAIAARISRTPAKGAD